MNVWWNMQDIIHYELLPLNQIIIGEVCCQQLEHLCIALQEKCLAHLIIKEWWPCETTHGQNSLCQVARVWIGKTSHPAYSPDLVPSDYKEVHRCFGSKFTNFFESGIQKLVEQWEKVVSTECTNYDD